MNSIEACNFAIDNNVNFLGFICYAKSPRAISLDFLKKIRNINFKFTRPVIVLVDPAEALVLSALEILPNAILQFHGNENEEFCKSFKQPYWKAIGISNKTDLSRISNYPSADAILLDTKKEGLTGGTGETFSWDLLHELSIKHYVLAGGINIDNIDQAIKHNPAIIDINSGIECSPGKKSISLMEQLLIRYKSHE